MGAAVVWSPAVPGSLQGCTLRGSSTLSEAYFPSCTRAEEGGTWKQAPLNRTLLESLTYPVVMDVLAAGPLEGVVAVPTNSHAVTAPSEQLPAGKKPAMAQLHVHIPPEAYQLVATVEGVCEL